MMRCLTLIALALRLHSPPRRFSGKRTNVGRRRETRETRRRDRAMARRDAEPVRQDLFEVGVVHAGHVFAVPPV